ncbi:AraC family transcriptional regulator [Microbulbifer sp. OS29]|uniref:AraC family transcriptional regulator n=1 Tax=Microbulbifer okhotskensis TaxID=2926617 RepID=A0A9X2J7P3_9GAMM|nr:AraC family transcriptional regulator [Microbulbifer okhotskensis]MCO1336809.1 AraC family transcriptional regulator [Microbulbifer okhotskensis]
MKNWKLSPTIENIAKYVECYWFLEKELHDQSFSYPKLNPDPSPHLIVANLDSTYGYTHSANTQNVRGSHWIFPHLKTFTMDHSAPFKIVGIKFKIGALYSLKMNNFSSKLDKIEMIDVNNHIGLRTFSPGQLLIRATEQKEQACNILDEALLPWLLDCHEDKHSHLVRQVMLLLGDTAIAEIGQKLHRSQRTIERSFVRVTGLSMKQVQSMIHLEEMLHYLYQLNKEEINWADVANKYGFSDQPHLIRHLKNSIGKTPANYVLHRDLAIDIYGDFEFE